VSLTAAAVTSASAAETNDRFMSFTTAAVTGASAGTKHRFMSFTTAAVTGASAGTNLLRSLHLRTTTTAQKPHEKNGQIKAAITFKKQNFDRYVQMHPSKFREMGIGPGEAAPALPPSGT
jgi:hypothetical protein